ncbi:MAG: hypothetical protein ABL893_07080 [Hyphomicrobium sp.]
MADVESVGRALAASAIAKVDRAWIRTLRVEPAQRLRNSADTTERRTPSPRELATQKLNEIDLPQQEALRLAIQRIAVALEASQAPSAQRLGSLYDTSPAASDDQTANAAPPQLLQHDFRQPSNFQHLAGWPALVAPLVVAPTGNEYDRTSHSSLRKNYQGSEIKWSGRLTVPPVAIRALSVLAVALIAFSMMY